MKLFNILAVLVTLSAAFSYFNYRYIRLPTTIGLMLIADHLKEENLINFGGKIK